MQSCNLWSTHIKCMSPTIGTAAFRHVRLVGSATCWLFCMLEWCHDLAACEVQGGVRTCRGLWLLLCTALCANPAACAAHVCPVLLVMMLGCSLCCELLSICACLLFNGRQAHMDSNSQLVKLLLLLLLLPCFMRSVPPHLLQPFEPMHRTGAS